MRPLSAADMLLIWERGQAQSLLARTLTLLAVASPETTLDQLAGLSLGRRDRLLFSLQAQTFGSTLNSYNECPNCAERLEFSVSVDEVLTNGGAEEETAPAVEIESWAEPNLHYQVSFRLPDSRDLAAIAPYPDVASARQELIRRCVVAVVPSTAPSTAMAPLAISELPAEILVGLAEEILRRDPLADITLDLGCPACGHRWQIALDIGAFLWAEINHQAKRLLRDVHALARAYGWPESDILAMSAVRRQAYLEMVL